MALPAGMGLSAAAAAAGFSYEIPSTSQQHPQQLRQVDLQQGEEEYKEQGRQGGEEGGVPAEDPEDMLLGGLAALSSEPTSPDDPGDPNDVHSSRHPHPSTLPPPPPVDGPRMAASPQSEPGATASAVEVAPPPPGPPAMPPQPPR